MRAVIRRFRRFISSEEAVERAKLLENLAYGIPATKADVEVMKGIAALEAEMCKNKQEMIFTGLVVVAVKRRVTLDDYAVAAHVLTPEDIILLKKNPQAKKSVPEFDKVFYKDNRFLIENRYSCE